MDGGVTKRSIERFHKNYLIMAKFKNYEKHEVRDEQGEVVIVNWLVEGDGKFIFSTLPISLIHFFCRKLFPNYSSVLELDDIEKTICFKAFNTYAEENYKMLLQKLPNKPLKAEQICLDTMLLNAYNRWKPAAHVSVIDAHSEFLDFMYWEEDIAALTELCLPWLNEFDYKNDFEFISRSCIEQNLQNQEQIDYYLDHYKLLNDSEIVYLAIYEDYVNFFVPVKNGKPLYIFVQHKQTDQNEAA
jgi:hypothetical protein